MLLIQRMFGDSCIGYDPGPDGEDYDHREWLKQRVLQQDDSEIDDSPICFVETVRRFSNLRQNKDWSCDGSARLHGELFCRECMDHVD